MVFMAKMEKVLLDSEETIAEVSYYTSESESEYEYETSEYYDHSINYGLFVDNDDDQEIYHDAIEFASENFNENHIKFNQKIAKCQKRIEKVNQQSKDLENQNKDLQDKYDVLKNQVNIFEEKNNEFNEHHVSAVKRIFRYLKGTINLGLWYLKDSDFDLTTYSDADHVGCHLDRKSTSGSVQFLGDMLVCWSSKKQNCVSISTTESKYVDVSGCRAQVLWMHTQLTDYGFFYDKVPIYCDSNSAIAISCNLVQHTRTKHIDVRYHFIKDHVEKGTIELYFIGTEFQLADLFTKSLPEARFKFLVEKLGMMSRET
ncbi:hypothetical protein Tco_1096923 [Tanacetum coccineum]